MVRLKTRYVLFEILYPETRDLRSPKKHADGRKIYRTVRQAVQENFGDLGMGQVQASMNLKYYNPETLTGILRVSREHARLAQAALTYVSAVDGQPVIVRVLRVSGTIRRSEQAAIRRDSSLMHHQITLN